MSKKLTKRAEDYSKWYNEIIQKADLAENSASKRLHGNQALWVCNMGKHASRIR